MPPRIHVVSVPGDRPGAPRFALVDPTGALLRPPDLAEVRTFDDDGAGGLVAPARAADGCWGYLDHTGRWRVEPGLDEAKRLASPGGLARFRRGDGWGYVDGLGQVVIEPRYRAAEAFSCGLAAVRAGRKFHYIDTAGRTVIEGPFKPAGAFSAMGLAAVRLGSDRPAGYVDTRGRMVIAPRFDEALPFSARGAAPVRIHGSWGLIDTVGDWILEPRYARMGEFDENGLAWRLEAGRHSNGSGYLDSTGRTVISGSAGLAPTIACGLVRDGSSNLCFLDRNGAQAFPGRFDWAQDFDPSCGATVARHRGRWGVLRADGEFRAVPYREPLAIEDEVIGFVPGQGVAPFLARDATVVYVNAAAEPVCRLTTADDGRLRVAAADSTTAWQDTSPVGWPWPPPAVLSRGPAEHFLVPRAWEGDVVAVAEELLAAEPVRYYPYSLVFGGRRSLDDLSGPSEQRRGRVHTGAMLVLAEGFVGEERWGAYEFLDGQEGETFSRYVGTLAERLSRRFGVPESDAVSLKTGDGNVSLSWPVESRRLVLECYTGCGDGEFENQLWLAVVEAEPRTVQEPPRDSGCPRP